MIDGTPTVAYLWARTLTCKNCRATIPLLKTRWLCKTENRRVVLTMEPNAEKNGLVFGVQNNVPLVGGSAAQRREYDKKAGAGTMTKSGAKCPICQSIMGWDDLRNEGHSQRFGATLTAVALDKDGGKGFRVPTSDEINAEAESRKQLNDLFALVPFGIPDEKAPEPFGPRKHGAALKRYGMFTWGSLFTPRQLLALGTLVKLSREARAQMSAQGFDEIWREAVTACLACGLDRLVDFCNQNTQWKIDVPTVNHALVRFAIPISWDYAEGNPIGDRAGSYWLCLNRVCVGLETLEDLPTGLPTPHIHSQTSTRPIPNADLIVTDPPYYDAVPYSDLMDWFYIWLRRLVHDLNQPYASVMSNTLSPKWESTLSEGELIDDPSRHQGDAVVSKRAYEEGMFQVFERCNQSLEKNGLMVVVFANKQPDAWETLVSGMIRAGFVVNGNWPIQTEQAARMRAQSSAALSSSVWLVCKKRPESARPGWDNRVLEEMRQNIHTRLRDYWDGGIRGPDFVWAATGPAMEAYSKHPVVKKANEPGKLMEVSEFLRAVRRLVVDFVVGRVLTGGDETSASGLDDVTTYYILHRHDFGVSDAPVGPCILYAISCNLSDRDLADRFEILLRTGGLSSADEHDEVDEEETDADAEPEEGTGSIVKLRPWHQRKRKMMGYDAEGHPAPLIDQVHRLMHLWKTGDVAKVDDYLDSRGLRKNALFLYLLQALIELLPWHRRSSYEPDAPARGVPQSPRWRVGLVCAKDAKLSCRGNIPA